MTTVSIHAPSPAVRLRGFGRSLLLLAAATLVACTHVPAQTTVSADLAIVGATVIDPRDGTRTSAQTVLVDDGRIVAVGAEGSLTVPADTQIVDGHGRFLIPGLWDMHVHALWDPIVRDTFLPTFAAYGVTGVRDMGGTIEVLQRIRAERNAAEARGEDLPWPRIVAPGPILDGPEPVDPSISRAISTPEQARAAVAELDALDVDFIKVYTLLPPEAYRAVVEEARQRGLPVAGHIPHGIDAIEAARGMRSIEHMRTETGGLCADIPADRCPVVLAALHERGVWQTPTLVPRRGRAFIGDPALIESPELALIPSALRSVWIANRDKTLRRISADGLRTRRDDFGRETAMAAELRARGIPMLAGSDAGADWSFPGSGLHDELVLLTDAGLTPRETLRMATVGAAEYFGLRDQGWIGAGNAADMVLLDADPLDDIRNTRRISAVVMRGRLYDRVRLDALLERARRAAASQR